MRKSSSSFLFPDIKVWLALSYERHVHYPVARKWFEQLDGDSLLCFCRLTQIGLLRLLTTGALMDIDVLSQADAWRASMTVGLRMTAFCLSMSRPYWRRLFERYRSKSAHHPKTELTLISPRLPQ
jgi:predicted nucleic acid-binding protein